MPCRIHSFYASTLANMWMFVGQDPRAIERRHGTGKWYDERASGKTQSRDDQRDSTGPPQIQTINITDACSPTLCRPATTLMKG